MTDTELIGGIEYERGVALSMAEQVLAPRTAPVAPQHGNREAFYLLANCRRLLTHYRWRNADNWVIAMELFGCGSNSGVAICHEAGIDPYSKKVERVK